MTRRQLAIALLLLVAGAAAIGFRVLEAANDPLDYDEYALLGQNKGTISAAVQGSGFAAPLSAYFWVAGRVCGTNIPCYRTGTLACSILLVLLMSLWAWRQWPNDSARAWGILVLLTSNNYSAVLAGYAMISYAFTVLMFAALLAAFAWPRPIRLSRLRWILLAAAVAVAGGLASFVALAGVASYAAAVAFVRRETEGHWRRSFRGPGILAIALIAVGILAVFVMVPFRNFGAQRLDMAPLFYPTAAMHGSQEPLLHYLLTRAYLVVATLLSSNQHDPVSLWAWRLVAGGLVTVGGLQAAFCPDKEPADRFVLLTVVFGLAGAALGGTFGLFPFGPRYVPFLLPPLVALGGLGASTLWQQTKRALPPAFRKGLLVVAAVSAALFWAGGLAGRKTELDSQSARRAAALSAVGAHAGPPILHDSHVEPLLRVRFPQRLAGALCMGWGTSLRKGEHAHTERLPPGSSVMVVTRMRNWEPEFPQWSYALTQQGFRRVSEYESPNLTVQLYTMPDGGEPEANHGSPGAPDEGPRGAPLLKNDIVGLTSLDFHGRPSP